MNKDWIIGDLEVFRNSSIDKIEIKYIERGVYSALVYLKNIATPFFLCSCDSREGLNKRLEEILN